MPRKKISQKNSQNSTDDINPCSQPENYIPIIPYTTSLCHRICENCGVILPVYKKDIERGKGMFCTLSCAATLKHHPKYHHICKTCGTPFKTTNPDLHYCSIECNPDKRIRNLI